MKIRLIGKKAVKMRIILIFLLEIPLFPLVPMAPFLAPLPGFSPHLGVRTAPPPLLPEISLGHSMEKSRILLTNVS